ncbi:MAG TPA: S1 family peptidase [Jiangellales bacterium]|nr:S1 family peptidase [Jiangellales bacterium]
MNRRIATLTGVALATVVVGALAVAPAASGAAGAPQGAPGAPGPDGDGLAPEIVAAVARDFGLTPEQARVRLDNEAKASRTELALRKELGDAFGGAYLDATATTLTVNVTNNGAANKVRRAGATPRLVARSEAALDAVKAELDNDTAPASIAGWHVDVQSNTVTVLARDVAAAEAFVVASGVASGAVRVVASDEQPRTFIDVIGGNAYFIGGSRCSVGFSVNGGFVTAGHCGSTGATTSQPSGTFAGSSFPGNDYAWVNVGSDDTPRGLVNNYSGGTVSVSGSTEAAVGASVCRSGSTTGWRCGTIQAKNSTVNYPQGTVTGLTRTNACAEPGDSGGSWLSGNQAQGVTSGGSGNCTSGGTTYFQPVNEILSVYGLTLVTGGSTPPPPPGTCSSFPNVYTGSLSSGGIAYQPNGQYYQTTATRTHTGCLDATSSSVDFDLYLQKWNGSSWTTVRSSTSAGPDESLSYSGTAGYYRFAVHAYSGSSSYTLGIRLS